MSDKLNIITEKIYKEGVEKAEQEAQEIINKAKEQAQKILDDAKAEKESMIKNAEQEIDSMKKNVESNLKISGDNLINKLKQDISELISTNSLKSTIQDLLNDKDFLSNVIIEIIKKWDMSSAVSIELLLPGNKKQEFDDRFISTLKQQLKDLKISFSDKVKSGFTIIEDNGNYKVSFEESSFIEFFKPYLREKTKQILFN